MQINGEKLKRVRIDKGKSIYEVAHIADLTPQRIQQIEKGRDTRLNNNISKAIAKFLGCKTEELI